MNLVKRAITYLLVIALLATPILACSEAETEMNEIRIGVVGPTHFVQGKHHTHGADLAAEEINKAGGIKIGEDSYRIKVIPANTNELFSVTDAASAMDRLINVNKVQFVMGGIRTEGVLAMQDIAMDNKVIFLGTGAADLELCTRVTNNHDRYKYWFRVTPVNSNRLGEVSFLMLGMVANAVVEAAKQPRVAILAEQAMWADPIVAAAQANLPQMGMQVAGTWRVSATTDQVTSELTSIKNSGANIIFTALSGPVGIHYAKKWGELEVPAASVGINVAAQDSNFWKAIGTAGNYETTLNMYARVALTEKTIPFYDSFHDKFGEAPTYNAGTYEAMYILKEAIERAGTLDPDAIVVEIEKTDRISAAGRIKFDDNHDVIWGPGYVTAIGVQWIDGEMRCIWPPADGDWEDVSYDGTFDYVLPPWM